jgi:periplasmic divalent cation tolerance protein
MKRKLCYFHLTCQPGNEQEIAQALLERRLIACAKFSPVHSVYRWNGSVEEDNEIYITLESASDLYDEVKQLVAETIRDYDTFVLTEVAIANMNDKARKWLNESLKEAA